MPIVDPKVEIEFTAGTWTDVTADVELDTGVTIKYGRTSEFSDAQTATCDFQLANHLGKYTPKAQLLADGATAHPYYPNVTPRKRVRVSNASGNRFVGYIKSWSPLLENGVRPLMVVSANDRQDQLSKINLMSFYEHELALTSPACSYLLTDVPAATGLSAVFLDSSGNQNAPLQQVNSIGVVYAPGAPNPMPQSDGLVGIGASSAGVGDGVALTGPSLLSSANFAFSSWITVPNVPATNPMSGFTAAACTVTDVSPAGNATTTTQVEIILSYGTGVSTLVVQAAAFVGASFTQVGSTITSAVPDDGLPHHYMMIGSTSGGTQTLVLYVDGVSRGSTSFAAGQFSAPAWHSIVAFTGAGTDKSIVNGPLATWAYAPASTVPAVLTLAGRGCVGDLSGARVARLLRYVGLSAGDYSVDAGVETLSGAQPIRGKSVVAACQEVATTEGAGSSFYINTDGLARFCDRTFRKPAAPNLTISASLDLDGQFAPTFDDLTLVNQSTVTRGGGNDLTYADAASQSQYGTTTDSATSYASTDAAALYLAQQRVSSQSTPGVRIPQFTVDLLTSSVAASAFAGMQIGWHARINTLPVGVNAGTQVDVIIEGWSESITKTSWTLTFDASPADNPARFVWDDTKYGRWGPGSTMTLASSITAAATSISVTTSAGNPTFTTAAGAYPLPIKIGEEEMTITAAPASSVSPQTLTVTRGASGTQAAAQAAGSRIDLSPSPRWTL